MTTKIHTDIPFAAPATSPVLNVPLGQLDSAIADIEALFGDFVVTGGLPGGSGSLTVTQPACRAFALNSYVVVAATTLVMSASKDNYVDLDSAGAYHISSVTLGAAAPAVFANSIRLYKAVSGASSVTSIVDLRPVPVNPFIDKGTQVYNVKAFGAKGDGVTDDWAAIMAAITAACATTAGGIIYFPAGTYMIGSTILVPTNLAAVGQPQGYPLVFTGAGYMQDGYWSTKPFGTMLVAKNLAGDMFANSNTANTGATVAFEKMTIVGNDAGIGGVHSSGHLLHFYNPMESWFRDLIVRSSQTDGIRLDGNGVPGNLVAIDHVRFEKCANGNGLAVGGSVQTNIYASHGEQNQAAISLGASSPQSTVYFSWFASNSLQHIVVSGAENVIAGCHFESSGHEAIQVLSARNTIVHNTCISNGTSGTDPIGIRLYGAGCTDNHVEGNTCRDGGGNKQLWGVSEEAGADFNYIVNNNLRGNVTSAIKSIVGANTIVRGNRGYNPIGATTAITLTTTVAVPAASWDRHIYITNGAAALTAVVTGVAGPVSVVIAANQMAPVFVPAGQTLTPTFASGVPTAVGYAN